MTTTVSRNGGIVLPPKLLQEDAVRAGQKFTVERISCGEYPLKRREGRANEGLVDWLVSYPERGWLHPMDRTETTAGADARF